MRVKKDRDMADDDLHKFSTKELLEEIQRQRDYLLAGWQESYRSAQYWRKRAADAERKVEDQE